MNPLTSFFIPTDKIKELRLNQIEALDKIWECIERGDTKITGCFPTGSGKTLIIDILFNYYRSLGKKCLYTSPLNQLVDQVEESEFDSVCTIKGRGAKNTKTGNPAYPCLAGRDDASAGYCQNDKCPSSKRVRDCRKRPYGACNTCVCWKCVYKVVYKQFVDSTKGNTNFTLMLLGVDNSPDVIALDECDVAESFIRSHYSITIPKLIDDKDFRHHVEPLTSYLEELLIFIDAIDPASENTTDAQLKERKELSNRYDKISDMLMDVENNKEPWCVSFDRVRGRTKYEPITIDRFLEPLLSGKTVFMMSATPPKFPGFSTVEVDSVFPIETRQWSYHPLGKMSKDYRDETIPSVAWWLSQLQGKTLVHCISYATAKKISDALRMLEVYPLLQINHDNGDEHTTSRYDAVNAFVTAKDPDKILLSVKLDRGVDFWQPDIIHNVIAVLPFPNPIEPLTKAKNRLFGDTWQNEQMAQDIAQAMGRTFRNELMGIYKGKTVPKQGHIIPTEFGRWYRNNRKLFPKWFTESKMKDKATP